MKLDYLFNDRHFYKQLIKLALPVAAQNLVVSSLNLVDNVMIRALGEAAIAGVGLANQYYFLLNLVMFGIVSGSSIFTAQFWGTKDIKSIRKVLGISIITGGMSALLFTIAGLIFPDEILGIFSKDPAVIQLGSEYLIIVLFSYVITAVTFAYSFSLRSMGDVKTPLVVSVIALGINTVLNYLLINGYLGFPRLGVAGAAIATVIARVIELVLLLWIIYRNKNALAASIREMIDLSSSFVKQFFKVSVPVILNESMWALGMTAYAVIYARMGTEVIASTSIAGTIEKIMWVIFFGFGNACAIMLGNKIGSDDKEQVFTYAKRFAIIAPAIAVIVGILVMFAIPWLLTPYKVSPLVLDYTRKNLLVLCIFLWVKIFNYTNVVGILRSGGDTTFCLMLDMGGVWLVGVPLVFLGGIIWQLPIYYVYVLLHVEEVVKLIIGIPRLASKKWINNLTTEMK